MVAEEDTDTLQMDPSKGSWSQEPRTVGQAHTKSNLEVSAGSGDAQHCIDEGITIAPPQSPTPSQMRRTRSSLRASRPSVTECLGADVPEEEMADLALDVYNMFFLSNMNSQAFFYSLAVLIVKAALYFLLLIDLKYKKQFPFEQKIEASDVVKVAQLFLMPVAIITQEELITSFFIFSHLKYSPGIKKRHPGAHKWKYFVAHGARFTDGFVFLVLNVSVMLIQIDDVLGLLLNFAALMFLQTIDNIALQVCLDGYWTKSLMEAAQDVVDMKIAYRHHYVHSCLQSSFVVIIWAAMLAIWGNVHYGSGGYESKAAY